MAITTITFVLAKAETVAVSQSVAIVWIAVVATVSVARVAVAQSVAQSVAVTLAVVAFTFAEAVAA